jgi:hypothetical protein
MLDKMTILTADNFSSKKAFAIGKIVARTNARLSAIIPPRRRVQQGGGHLSFIEI